MPPKKKPVEESADDADRSLLSIEDFNLPKSMILRLAKGVLPPNTSVQKDAVTAILKSTTVFINYLASNADDRAQLANKKTIRPEDVFGALEEIEFGPFKQRVEQELTKYQEVQNSKRNDYRRRVKGDQTLPRPEDEEEGASLTEDSQRDKSTTPRVVTLGNGDRDRDHARRPSSLRFSGVAGPDDTETDADDEPPAAKRARKMLDGDIVNARHDRRDDDETLSDVEEDETGNEEVDDEEEDVDNEDAEEDDEEEEEEDDDDDNDDNVGEDNDNAHHVSLDMDRDEAQNRNRPDRISPADAHKSRRHLGFGAMNPDPDDDGDDDDDDDENDHDN